MFIVRCLVSIAVKLVILAMLLSVLVVLPWRWLPPPTSSFMLQTLAGPGLYDYRWRSYDEISANLALAAIAAEDQRFPEHHGFDFTELKNAVEDYGQGGSLRGASTISQQVAKNLYLWSGQTLLRKSLEAWFTLLIEWLWSKQRILEIYLNIAQFGDRTFGAEAASQRFFQISAQQLSAEESALLAAVLPAPEVDRVEQPSPEVLARQTWILQQMAQLGPEYLQKISPDRA